MASQHIRPARTVVDIGSGIRPQPLIAAERMICVEPHAAYADHLRAQGHEVMQMTAAQALPAICGADAVVMLDVLEHMDKAEGRAVLDLALKCAAQVIVFTPLGFIEQHGDAWGMGGEHWQAHRSGWVPDDFPGWSRIVDARFHNERGGAFFAISP